LSNAGQVCTATSRILVQDTIYDKFLAGFKAHIVDTHTVGDPFAKETTQGPQVNKVQYDKILSYIQSGKDEGAELVLGGAPDKEINADGTGYYLKPTIFGKVKSDMKIYKEEIFGPCVVVTSFKTEAEAIEMANDTTYGLGSAVFTSNLKVAHRVAAKIDAGMVWINSSQDSDFRIPFGGVKQSGFGRELGQAGLDAYTTTKAVHVNLGLEI